MRLSHVTLEQFEQINIAALYRDSLPFTGFKFYFKLGELNNGSNRYDCIYVYSLKSLNFVGALYRDNSYYGPNDYSLIVKFSPAFTDLHKYYKSFYLVDGAVMPLGDIDAVLQDLIAEYLKEFI